MNIDLKKEIERFPGTVGVESAHTPPASWYTSPEFFSLDAKALKKNWQPVGSIHLLKEDKSFFSGDFLGEPYVVVKGSDGEIRAFYNVCRHHATCLVKDSGVSESSEFVCPYHGWTYGLDGALKRAPQLGAIKNFQKEKMGLVPIPVHLFGPLIFLNFSRQELAFPDDWSSLKKKLDATEWEKLHFVKRKSYEIKCNWKVYVDNYLDGGYHVQHLHKDLAGQLNLEDYKIENFTSHTIQSCEGAQHNKSERIGGEALYVWLHPNFMINRYGDIMDTNWVIPLGPDRCLTVFDYYFIDHTTEKAKLFIAESLKASDVVQQEDIEISESVQRGLNSAAYDIGRYAPVLESGAYLFHQLLQRDLREVLE